MHNFRTTFSGITYGCNLQVSPYFLLFSFYIHFPVFNLNLYFFIIITFNSFPSLFLSISTYPLSVCVSTTLYMSLLVSVSIQELSHRPQHSLQTNTGCLPHLNFSRVVLVLILTLLCIKSHSVVQTTYEIALSKKVLKNQFMVHNVLILLCVFLYKLREGSKTSNFSHFFGKLAKHRRCNVYEKHITK